MQKTNKSELDAYFFHQGTATEAYLYLGCHAERIDAEGESYRYIFRTWAPSAHAVFLVSDRTGWEEGLPFRRVTERGVWECILESEGSLEGMPYKFRICSGSGVHLKGDPYARASRGGADGASLVTHPSTYVWGDDGWMAYRRQSVRRGQRDFLSVPLNIYEMHLGSFDRAEDGSYLPYPVLAERVASYVKRMGYTHVEILPVAEHPYDGSWGYQVCGFYAPTSRFGTPDGFRTFVDTLHRAGIGVIMDWVPAHFPKDEWGLYEFDGQPLYEYQGYDRMESRSWGTRFFDLGREEVQSFLVSNAVFWLREYHIDGLRVDAVASMLYLDYDRMPGEWIPNVHGDRYNLEAIAFLKKMNQTVHELVPDALTVAEESTAFGGVTHPVSEGGLGFDLKWNMGFANDFYDYLGRDPVFRRYHHKALNFPILYAYAENYVLPVSHDEVVHGKRSLIDKISGSYEDKFRTLRAALMFIMSFPGKKLMFMGSEYGQFVEWNYERSLEWFMTDYPAHAALQEFSAALNAFYLASPPLYEQDFSEAGFSWIYADEADRNLVAYRRHAEDGDTLTVAVSFSGAEQWVRLPAETGKRYTVCFDSAGTRKGELLDVTADADGACVWLRLSPLEAVYLEEYQNGTKLKI